MKWTIFGCNSNTNVRLFNLMIISSQTKVWRQIKFTRYRSNTWIFTCNYVSGKINYDISLYWNQTVFGLLFPFSVKIFGLYSNVKNWAELGIENRQIGGLDSLQKLLTIAHWFLSTPKAPTALGYVLNPSYLIQFSTNS